MTVAERIKAIIALDCPIAFDGCHKFYMLTNTQRVVMACNSGYSIYAPGELQALWEDACSLKFISQWGLDSEGNAGFRHELEIKQFEEQEENEDDERDSD